MKKALEILFAALIVLSSTHMPYAESTIMVVNQDLPKGYEKVISPDLGNFVKSSLVYSLNDLSEVFSTYNFVTPQLLERWYNSLIDIINQTNTNVIVVGKKKVTPKKLSPISLAKINPKVLKDLANVITSFKGYITISYKVAQSGINISYTLFNENNAKVKSTSLGIPLSKLSDTNFVLLSVKEKLVDLMNVWTSYYYDPLRVGELTINITPATAVKSSRISLKPSDIALARGKNTVPEGNYLLIVEAQNFEVFLTNITILPNSKQTLKITLSPKKTPTQDIVPMGTLYLDSDVKNVSFIIAEGNIFGKTPILTNVVAGTKNIIFQETEQTRVKNVSIEVKPDQFNYVFVNMDRKGGGVRISTDPGAYISIDRKLLGITSDGNFSQNLSRGLHIITIFKHGYEPFRTNVNITTDTPLEIKAKLQPRKVPVFVVTPQVTGASVKIQEKVVAKTPSKVLLTSGIPSTINVLAQRVGFTDGAVEITPKLETLNESLIVLSPLYGDLLVISEPPDALVKIDGVVRGKTQLDGFILRTIPSKDTEIEIRKEGYRAIKTNVYIAPNVQNAFNFKLTEAPIKVFFNTLGAGAVDIYVNEEYYGNTQEGVISMPTGNLNVKIVKRGFKTMYTNFSFPEKIDSIVLANTTLEPGLSEIEVIETLNQNLEKIDLALSNNDFLSISTLIEDSKKLVNSTGYTNSKQVLQVRDLISKKEKELGPDITFAILNFKADKVINEANLQKEAGNYSNSVEILRNAISEVKLSELDENRKSQILAKLNEKYKEVGMVQINNIVSNYLAQAQKFIALGEKSAASSLFEESLKIIDTYLVDIPEVKENITPLRDSILSNYISIGIEVISNKVNLVLLEVEKYEKQEDYTNAIRILSENINSIKRMKIYEIQEVKDLVKVLEDKNEEMVQKSIEKEQIGEVKVVYEEIKPIIKEAVRLTSIKEYDSAINKYKEALKIIELSELKENPFLKKLKENILQDISSIEAEKAKEEELLRKKKLLQEELEAKKRNIPWWTRMQKSWSGVGFEFRGFLLGDFNNFDVTNVNIPIGAKIHVSILPVFGLNFGGFYNINAQSVSSNYAYLLWAGLGEVELRIPIIENLSIFGNFGTGIGQKISSTKFRLGEDYFFSAGLDVKFRWFGIRLSYEMAFFDQFQKNQMGAGASIILWATEN